MSLATRPALPKGLEPIHIEKAVGWVEEQTSDLVDLYYEQANVFSGIVGIFGAKALAAFSPSAGSAGGGRTHTFGLRQPAQRLRDAAGYRAPGIVLKGKTPVLMAS
jgi:hypothetical protein